MEQIRAMTALLEHHGLEVPKADYHGGSASGTPRSEHSLPRPILREAEQRIIQKGAEVAEKAAEMQRAEHALLMQQQASAQSWERTQQREEASKRLLMQSQHTHMKK